MGVSRKDQSPSENDTEEEVTWISSLEKMRNEIAINWVMAAQERVQAVCNRILGRKRGESVDGGLCRLAENGTRGTGAPAEKSRKEY